MAAAHGAFPLPSGYLRASRELSENEKELYRALARDRLNATLVTERELRHNQRARRLGGVPGAVTRVDPREWKPVRSKHDLRVFRRRGKGRSREALASAEDHRDVARAVEAGQPSLLCIGRVEGSLEDLLYGLYNPSQDEVQAVTRHVDERVLDCASLATIETAAGSENRRHPMHYLGLKWMLAKLPGSLVVLPRDVCFLEALGVTSDYDGRRLGYLVQHSVEDRACPPFDERATGIMRAQIYFTYIFRENTSGFVDVFARGVLDAPGLMPKFVSAVTASTLLGLFNVVRCAQAKKLTLLASRRAGGSTAKSDHEVVGRPHCGICSRKPSNLDLTRPRTCQVCRVPVCSKCRSTRTMFVRSSLPDRISLKKVVCCVTCVIEAKTMRDINPCDPESALFSLLEHRRASQETHNAAATGATAAPVSVSRANRSEDPIDDGAIASSNCSNDSKDGRATASSSGSLSSRGRHLDLQDLSSRSIVAAGFVESIVDERDLPDCIGESEYEDGAMSDTGGSELDSEPGDDTTDDEAIDVDEFNGDTTPMVIDELAGSLDSQETSEVGAAFAGFAKQFQPEGPSASSYSRPMGSSDPSALLEKIMALQTSVQEAYSMTQANKELMAKMMRHE